MEIIAFILAYLTVELIFYFLNPYLYTRSVYNKDYDELYHSDDIMGYSVPSNSEHQITLHKKGKQIYRCTYSIDAYSRRCLPNKTADQFLIFFGCSFVFGEGVEDKETMPYYFQNISPFQVYNYGIPGYGPQHMLRKLQLINFNKEVQQEKGCAIYVFIDEHIERLICSMKIYNNWGKWLLYYSKNKMNQLNLYGTFENKRLINSLYEFLGKSHLLRFIEFDIPFRIKEKHIEFTSQIIIESAKEFHQHFPESEFYVLLYPGTRYAHILEKKMEQNGIRCLNFSQFIDLSKSGNTIEGDPHPSPQTHQKLAEEIHRWLCHISRFTSIDS